MSADAEHNQEEDSGPEYRDEMEASETMSRVWSV